MQAIQWHSTTNQYVISISRDIMDKDEFFEVLRWLRFRFLLQKADFEKDIEELGEELLAEWWENNKQRFIPAEG